MLRAKAEADFIFYQHYRNLAQSWAAGSGIQQYSSYSCANI
jgi:hypothetical protein